MPGMEKDEGQPAASDLARSSAARIQAAKERLTAPMAPLCRHRLFVVEKGYTIKLKAVKLALIIAILGASGGVYAHGIAGNRYFPGSITFDDPTVADELILPAWSRYETDCLASSAHWCL